MRKTAETQQYLNNTLGNTLTTAKQIIKQKNNKKRRQIKLENFDLFD